MFKFRHKDTVYFRWGLTAFLTVIAILAVYDIIFGPHKLAGYLGLLGGVITPVLYGCAIAYLLAPSWISWNGRSSDPGLQPEGRAGNRKHWCA